MNNCFDALLNRFDNFIAKSHRDSFNFYDGIGNTIVSCPHSVSQLRDNKIKFAEPQTGILALILNKLNNVPIIIKLKNMGDDANYDQICPYKEFLVNKVNENKYKFIIDLHMLSATREIDINLGIAGGNNFPNKTLLTKVAQIFKSSDFSVSVDDPFTAEYPYTVSSYLHAKTGIFSLQIEINSKLLYNPDTYQNTRIEDVYRCLSKIVEVFNNESN